MVATPRLCDLPPVRPGRPKVSGFLGAWGSGRFGFWVLGLKGLGFGVQGLGFRV